MPTKCGSGTKKKNITSEYNINTIAITINNQYHSLLNFPIRKDANYIPIIFPTLGQVAHSPTQKPLLFLGNQLDIMAI
jgi:hypothetical protein